MTSTKERKYLPIAKWANLRKEDGKLYANAQFDDNDEFAQKVKQKVKDGYIKGASIGFNVLATSDNHKDLVKRQVYNTVTKLELLEISIVDIPSNKNNLKLYNNTATNLLVKDNNVLPKIIAKTENIEEIKKQLELQDTATTKEVVNKRTTRH